jgi:hypothetical protein
MVRNSEKKTTRKIRKNRQTRRKRVLKMKTKMRKNRMHKTMKGGDRILLTTLREQLKPIGDLGKQINLHLNGIVEFIGMKLEPGNTFITSYNAAPKLAASVAFTPVAPAAGTEQKVQFIPNNFIREIPVPIQVLITEIKEQYRKLCRSSSSPCGNSNSTYKLTPVDFDRVLDYVCKGEVHKVPCVGAFCSKIMFKKNDEYVELINSLYNWSRTFHGTSSQKSPNLDFTIRSEFRQTTVNRIYTGLNTILPNELLTPNGIIYKACIIVMPPFIKAPMSTIMSHMSPTYESNPDPITRGYKSFTHTHPRLYEWKPLGSGEKLAPNMYCKDRMYKRMIHHRLAYTMSPLEIPKDLLPPVSWLWQSDNAKTFNAFSPEHAAQLEVAYQSRAAQFEIPEKSWRFDFHIMRQFNTTASGTSRKIKRSYDYQHEHDVGLEAMANMISNLTRLSDDKKAKLQSDFETNKKVEMTHISYKDGYYFYYELKIQKTTIPLDSTTNTTKIITAVIIEFKVFSEDGICSKEIIFVSYKRPPETDSVLPGAVIHNDNEQVSPDTMNSAINKLFNEMFLELERSLYQVKLDQSVLTMTGDDQGNFARGAPLQNDNAMLQPLAPDDPYGGICTIILTQNIGITTMSIAKATTIQQRAFTAVNEHITKTSTGWNFERGQKTFEVNNQKTGNQEIKVTVRVFTVNEGASNQLLSAIYQAQDLVPYRLFANKDEAQKYLQSIMMI